MKPRRLFVFLALSSGGAFASDSHRDDVEEVIVTSKPPEHGLSVPMEYMQHTYSARGKGSCLYKHGRYEEALPYLLAAAKRGFKFAQARVGYIYERGIGGVDRDPYEAVGWYAVAADGRTHPSIRQYFDDVWKRIPEKHLPRFEAVAQEYRTRYGTKANRVICELDRAVGSHLPKLTCRFSDEALHHNYFDFIEFIRGEVFIPQWVPNSMEPVKSNMGSC
ncbi:MAG: sel1 repeat family protein [Pseudomonadales bacterium]|nr:sel1 repeat family protein [Pseudomonadales bacterium]